MYKIKGKRDKLFVGIDPGMNGGIAFIKPEMDSDFIKAHRCPKTVHDMATLFGAGIGLANSIDDVVLFIEHVWTFPGDGRVGAFRFGYNYGIWKGIAGANEVDLSNIPPRKWQGSLDIPDKLHGRERKKWLKEYADSLYPNIKVTFNNADAILIANYAMECYYKDEMPDSELGIGVIQ
tara:strand:- start:63 stop:596 length:534 start_codon:yes stop_codon:yes gene_type:complete